MPAGAFALIGCLTALHSAAEERGFVPLFNGTDLKGWRMVNVAADTFSAVDRMITTTGVPKGVMATERQYENFVLELEWRHLEDGGNSGVMIWAEGLPAPGAPYPRAIEVQMLDQGHERKRPEGANVNFTTHGDIFPIRGATMTTVGRTSRNGQRSFPSEERSRPSPQWNHYRVVCNEGEIRLSVNGEEVTVGRDCVPRKGFICLESEGMRAQFRNIRIKELPSSNTPPELTAESYAGFMPLLDGKGFGGWRMSEAARSVWTVEGMHFAAKAGVQGRDLDLWTEREYRDFELIADWRLTQKPELTRLATFTPDGLFVMDGRGERVFKEIMHAGDSGIHLRGSPRHQVNIWSQPMGSGDINALHKDASLPADIRRALVPIVNADRPFGQWNRFRIKLKGDAVTVELNGETVIDQARLPGIPATGPIGLQYHRDEIEFANVYIREL